MPPTERSGTFGFFSFVEDEASHRLFGSLLDEPLSFHLIVIGDNDADRDCMWNEDLRINIDYSYVEK